MTVTITPIGVGTVEGDDTGDKARVGAQSINANEANLKAAVESLEGRFWTVRNTTLDPLVIGTRYMANNHAGITFTTPATFTLSATAVSDIWITNADDASNITLTPASGDAFFVDGATHGVDTTYAITPGNLVILSPRTTDSEWDLLVIHVAAVAESLSYAVSDETTVLTTGVAKTTFRMPYAFTLTEVRASVTTATGAPSPEALLTIDINENSGASPEVVTSILSTKLTIDAGERTSTTATTAAVISDTSLADDAEMTIDIDVADGASTGLKVYLIGIRV